MTDDPRAPRRFLLGPTASGKTAVGVELARRLDAEILSLDSMLVYRGMDVGTAKPAPAERGGVPHHLMDLVPPSEAYSVARWREAAAAAEAAVRARGKAVLYVGGTPMWFKALVHGLMDAPDVPEEVRAAVRAEARSPGGRARLGAELAERDPAAAERIHPHDEQRLLRAVEVLRATGKPLSAWQSQWRSGAPVEEPAVMLDWPRAALHARVEERFRAMLDAGLLAEVRAIRAGCGFGPTARKAIGYRQLLRHLEGACTLEEAVRDAVRATRVLVRRQSTWLRGLPGVRRLAMVEGEPASVTARRAEAALHAEQEP